MVLTTVREKPPSLQEDQESLVDSIATPVVDFIQFAFMRTSAVASIQAIIRRPAGSKDSLTSTVLHASFPSAWNLTLSVCASARALGVYLVPVAAAFAGRFNHPQTQKKKTRRLMLSTRDEHGVW